MFWVAGQRLNMGGSSAYIDHADAVGSTTMETDPAGGEKQILRPGIGLRMTDAARMRRLKRPSPAVVPPAPSPLGEGSGFASSRSGEFTSPCSNPDGARAAGRKGPRYETPLTRRRTSGTLFPRRGLRI
ncbi:MAG TPA: hypothetical protein VFL79_12770 [Terriglobia bacterium]|nr:hypothetical protein [Terriglobia bacterium]